MKTGKTMSLSVSAPLFLFTLLLGTGGFLVSGCAQSETVGEAGSGGASMVPDTSDDQTGTGSQPTQPDDCSESPDLAAPFLEWKATPNSVESLAGSTWKGYLLGGFDLTLTIAEDNSAVLQVGEAVAAPMKDQGYLCSDAGCSSRTLNEGGAYAVHGASFANNRLRFDLKLGAAYEEWCGLQTVFDVGDCSFAPLPNDVIRWPDPCKVGEEVVDCQWFSMHFPEQTCQCTSEGCIPYMPETPFDATFDAEAQSLEGVIGQAQFILTRVDSCADGAAGASGSCAE